jgi:hypothetical protein
VFLTISPSWLRRAKNVIREILTGFSDVVSQGQGVWNLSERNGLLPLLTSELTLKESCCKTLKNRYLDHLITSLFRFFQGFVRLAGASKVCAFRRRRDCKQTMRNPPSISHLPFESVIQFFLASLTNATKCDGDDDVQTNSRKGVLVT